MSSVPHFGSEGSQRLSAERQAVRDDVIARYGNADAAMSPSPDETALVEACRPLIEAGKLDPHFTPQPGDMDPDVAEAVRGALPFPTSVTALLAEYMAWDRITRDRTALNPDWMQPVSMGCRERLLEEALDAVPARSFADIEARLAWMQIVLDFGFSRDVRDDEACLNAIRADIARLASRSIELS